MAFPKAKISIFQEECEFWRKTGGKSRVFSDVTGFFPPPKATSTLAPPAMSDVPKIHITLPSGEIRKYSLQMDSIRIGRAADNTVVLEDGSLSAHHAVLHRRDNGFEIVDLGSTNGIEVDGRRVLTHDLRHGDEVKIGSVLLRFDWPGQPAPPASGEFPAAESPAGESAGDDAPEKPAVTETPVAPSQRRDTVPSEPKSGCLASLMLFALTLLAPVIGMHIRHYQESGGKVLISEILQHVQGAKKAETPPSAQP
jgi:pSer/pThr/pTyr-binding forkhead associated (FHA) protein